MQFKIPQNVQREDTVIGPVTFKQLAILLVGGGLTYAVYLLLAQSYIWTVWLPPVVILGGLTAAIAFLKFKDMNFVTALLYFVEFNFKPKIRVWKQGLADVRLSILQALPEEAKKIAKNEAIVSDQDRRQKLLELSKSVDRLSTLNQ